MVFAHTTVEAPKYGASRRTAAISAPSDPVPTTKTSRGRGGIPSPTLTTVRRVPSAATHPERAAPDPGPGAGGAGARAASANVAEHTGDGTGLAAADHARLWHPFTQQQGWVGEEPLVIARAEGTDLIDVEGCRYIDG